MEAPGKPSGAKEPRLPVLTGSPHPRCPLQGGESCQQTATTLQRPHSPAGTGRTASTAEADMRRRPARGGHTHAAHATQARLCLSTCNNNFTHGTSEDKLSQA